MKKFFLPLTLIFLAFVLPLNSWGKLSRGEWKNLQRELVKNYKNKNFVGVGDVLKRMGRDNSKRAVRLIVKIMPKLSAKEACCKGAVEALGSMTSSEARKEMGRRLKRSSTRWKVQLLIIDGMAKWEGKDAVPYLVEVIDDRNQRVASAAIRLLGKLGGRQAVDALAKRMSRLDRKKGVEWEDCQKALTRILGVELSSGTEYKSWVKTRGYGRKVTGSGHRKKQGGGTTVSLFGMEINCKQSVFIIDVSGSMKTTDPLPGGGHMGTTRRGEKPKVNKDRMRIRRAKKELKKVISNLRSSQEFNIIAYSHEVWVWSSRGCKRASSSNKKSAREFVDNFKAKGVTATDMALAKAYKTSPKAQCFYLLSDGAPTRDGTNIIPTEHILELILKHDRFRRVKIHTLGFRGASVEFMKAVANLTGGNYRDIK